MSKQNIDPPDLFPSRQYGFSQVVAARGRTTIYISGQVAWDSKEEIVGPGDLGVQARQALRNVERAVKAAGGMLADVVSLRIYIVSSQMGATRPIREALLEFFPDNPPATTWIGVYALANPDFLIEIEPVAVID